MRIGIADHLGWAIAVTASADHEGSGPAAKIRLTEPGISPAPIHTSRRLDVAGTATLVAEARASIGRAASAALDELAAALHAPVVSISLRTWPPDFPDDIESTSARPTRPRPTRSCTAWSSPSSHTPGAGTSLYDAKAVVDQAISVLAERADEVLQGPRTTLEPTLDEGPSDRARRDGCSRVLGGWRRAGSSRRFNIFLLALDLFGGRQGPRAEPVTLTGATEAVQGEPAANSNRTDRTEVTMNSMDENSKHGMESQGRDRPGRFEVTTLPVADVDRAKAFYERLGWRLDIDFKPSPGRSGRAVHATGLAGVDPVRAGHDHDVGPCGACSWSSGTSGPGART